MKSNLCLYNVDFSHLRLLDLTKLADQAEPFYKWVEKKFQIYMHSGDTLENLLKIAQPDSIKNAILSCYLENDLSSAPKLFDGGGIPYKHKDACFFFFSWLARDAATQRLTPLISLAMKSDKKLERVKVEAEILSLLLYSYRDNIKFFEWKVFREVALNRLEGSRRAKRGSAIETYIRTAITESFSYYYKTRGNYGEYADFKIIDKPFKVKNRTYDVAAILIKNDGTKKMIILPVKTRETQGGGHSHLFTRDIEQANQDILELYPNSCIIPVIIAQNWSLEEIHFQEEEYGNVFYFNQNPNTFSGFNYENQKKLNAILEKVLEDEL